MSETCHPNAPSFDSGSPGVCVACGVPYICVARGDTWCPDCSCCRDDEGWPIHGPIPAPRTALDVLAAALNGGTSPFPGQA